MLGDEIGKGAYGRVYKGLDLENGDFVAIKQVSLENIPHEDLSIIMLRNISGCVTPREGKMAQNCIVLTYHGLIFS
ncbi:hypothetical protein BHE74_00011025 [Ensete ventricosum]|nr:hypothetical protein GW17_00002399 [Ensete ventricosum]RWW80624.1 hypothetical protein BHE74_00011025 [Ensete ventricosum]RZR83127.1 hypothetical protein BHM03_00009672 [Ensete ventricosum]